MHVVWDPRAWMHIDWALGVAAGWIVLGLIGGLSVKRTSVAVRVLFPAGGALGALLGVVAAFALLAPPQVATLPIGLPGLPFHLRLDALSAFFLAILGAASAGVSAFAAGYFRANDETPPGLVSLQYHAFLASMALVVLADDAYAFMVAWETMALSSYFLVTTNHRVAEIRQAGYLYLLIAPTCAINRYK